MSPLATPLSMMSALRSGRYRLPSAWMSSSARTDDDRSGVRARGRSGSRPINVSPPRPACLGRSRDRTRRSARRPTRKRIELVVGHPAKQGFEVLAALGCHLPEDGVAGIGRVDEDDPPIGGVVAALDEAALLHPVDDPGRARDRHVEGVGELRHRQRTLRLEDREDVQVDEAQRPAQPMLERPCALARAPRRQLVQEVLGGLASRGRAGKARTTRPGTAAFSQCHVDNLCDL